MGFEAILAAILSLSYFLWSVQDAGFTVQLQPSLQKAYGLISPVFYGLEQVRDRPQMEAVAEFDLIALWNLPVKPFLFRAPMTAQLHRQ
jgi:hypothetical protein